METSVPLNLHHGHQPHEGLLAAIISYVRPRIVSTFALLGSAALLEGAGLVMILPVANIIFSQELSGPTGTAMSWLARHGIETVTEQLALIGAAFLVLIIARASILLRRDMRLQELSQGFVDQERRRLFRLLAGSDWPVIKRHSKANLLNAMTVNVSRLLTAMIFLMRWIVTVLLAIAALGAAFIVHWSLGLLLLVLSAACAGLALVWSRRSKRSGDLLNRAAGA